MKLDMSKFKKISGDKDYTVMQHDDGHTMKIAHEALSPKMRSQMLKLPIHDEKAYADGGEVKKDQEPKGQWIEKSTDPDKRKRLAEGMQKAFGKQLAEGGEVKKKDKGPYIDPKAAKEVEQGATASGWQPEKWKKNLKQGLGLAEGGEVSPKLEQAKKQPPDRPLQIERLQHDEPKEHLDYERIKPKHPVDYEPMADGGEVLQLQTDPTQMQVPQMGPSQFQQDMEAGAAREQGMGPMPAMQQPSMAPITAQEESMPQAPEPMSQAPSVMGGYEKEVAGKQAEAEALAQQGKQQERALGQQLGAMDKLMGDYQSHFQDLDKERKAFQQDIIDKHIDPNKYFGDMSTGEKMATAFGLILGGIGGGGQGNQALDFLNKQIDRDIDAQRAELGKRETLLSANMKQFGNLKDATEMTKVMMHDQAIAKLKMAEAKAQSPLAKARAQQEIGKLEAQIAPMVQQLATRRMLDQVNQGGDRVPAAVTPESFVPSVVPKEHQEAVYKEIERASNTKQVAKTALQNFDKVVKEMQAAGGLGRLGVAAYSPAQLQALEAELGSTVGDMEGTVRETAMHNVKNAYLPRATDSPARLKERRKELANYLKLKSSAPRAKSYGIDLDKFESTSRQQPEIKTLNGIQYEKVQGGWKRVK